MNFLERIHLEIILAVEKEGSMTAAADSLHLTQSALSHSIRKLEEQLEVKIWQRKGRQLIPTQAGEYLLNTSKRLIRETDSEVDYIEAFLELAQASQN